LTLISDNGFLESVRDKGAYFRTALGRLKDKYPKVIDVMISGVTSNN